MNNRAFQPGFRWSIFDVLVLVTAVCLMGIGYLLDFGSYVRDLVPLNGAVALFALPIVAFFLFCNVFRVSRPLELLWASVYVGLLVAVVQFGVMIWPIAVGIAAITMIGVIVVEMRRPSYHGVGWKRINPSLPSWWDSHTSP